MPDELANCVKPFQNQEESLSSCKSFVFVKYMDCVGWLLLSRKKSDTNKVTVVIRRIPKVFDTSFENIKSLFICLGLFINGVLMHNLDLPVTSSACTLRITLTLFVTQKMEH